MWPRRPLGAAVALVALVVLVVPAAGVAALSPSPAAASHALPADGGPDGHALRGQPVTLRAPAPTPAQTAALAQQSPPPTIRVNLTESGDARWTVTSRVRLNDSTDRAAFRAMVDDLENGTASPPVGYSAATFRRFADRVATVTDRSMTVTDARWDGTVHNDTGAVTLSFTWTNFARTDGDRVVLGDVFAADVGWFASLTDDQQLVIAPPPDYAVVTTGGTFPVGEQGVIRVDGPGDLPADVSTENVSVVYAPTAAPPTQDPPGGLPAEFVGGGVLLAVLVVLGGTYLLYGRGADDPAPGPGTTTGTGTGGTSGGAGAASTGDAAADTATAADATPSAGTDPGATDTPPTTDADDRGGDPPTAEGGADATTTAAGDGAAGDTAVDEELLSDEERVERLLSENGGRMKQASIVSETGWSNAKVSQLLTGMHEDGRVDKLRIGRENLISLPDESVVDSGGTSDASTADGTPASSDAEDS